MDLQLERLVASKIHLHILDADISPLTNEVPISGTRDEG